jgi:uncharacterized protein (UPF0548 family)
VRLLWPGQRESLSAWTGCDFAPGSTVGPGPRDRPLVFARELASEPPGPPLPDGPFRRVAAAIMAYQIFPPHVVQGTLARVPVEVGDTVAIAYQLGGGFRLAFATRVFARFDGPVGDTWRAGFSYRTLVGHPELGEETFVVEKTMSTGAIRVALDSWSRAGIWLTRLGEPVMRVVQRRASLAALAHLSRKAG